MRQRIAVGQRPEGAGEAAHEEIEARGRRACQTASGRRGREIGLSMATNPVGEALAVPGLPKKTGQLRQGCARLEARAFPVPKPLLGPLIDVKSEMKDREQPVRIVVPGTQLGIPPARRLADRLQHGPWPRVWREPAKQVLPTELADQIGAPPSKPGLLATLACPGDEDLGREEAIQLGGKDPRWVTISYLSMTGR